MSLDLLLRRRDLLFSGEKIEEVDTDGLIAYWVGSDSPINGKWIDRINSFPLILKGTAVHTNRGYELNNLSNPKNAYMWFDDSYNSTFNGLLDKQLTCFIKCSLKFNTESDIRACPIIDFGAFGASRSTFAWQSRLASNGNVNGTYKIGNSTSGFEETTTGVNCGTAFISGVFHDIDVETGVRLLASGKQEIYNEYLNTMCHAIITTPKIINFDGCNMSTTSAFTLGLGYTTAEYATNFMNHIIYHEIRLYKKIMALPSGYIECEYINRTEGDQLGAYINTNVSISSNLRVVAKFMNDKPSASDKYPAIFGARDGNITYRFECYAFSQAVHLFSVTGSSYGTSYRTIDSSPHTIDISKDRLIYDGIEYQSSNTTTWNSDKKLYIASLNLDGRQIAKAIEMKIYYFKMFNGNDLVRDFVPAYSQSSNKYGLYDLVNGTFYPSADTMYTFSGLIKS